MKLRFGCSERTGPAVDARDLAVEPTTLHAAIRDPENETVIAPTPGPASVHDHVGLVRPTHRLQRRCALTAAARSRGATTPLDDQRRTLQAELDAHQIPETDVPAALEAVADAAATVESLRDRVARLGGIVDAMDGADAVAEARVDLRAAAADLAEAETAQHAARQRLDRERGRQRAANDAREARLRLQDRIANLEREIRRRLAAMEEPRLERARAALPDWPAADRDAELALALARIARIRAPVVLVDAPFRTPVQARTAIAAPVVLASSRT